MKDVERVFPHWHPLAQASGRWSTTDPPLVNFPANDPQYPVAWGMIVPDPGWVFLHYDMDSLHARIAAAYTKDPDDLAAFRNGWDVHTSTACRMFGWSFLPPNQVGDPLNPPWAGKQDRRRHLAKTLRYALLLGLNEHAALRAPEIHKLGLTHDEILQFARAYLRSKPEMVATRKRIWAECLRVGRARSFMGRLRRLTFDPRSKTSTDEAMKEGWSHILQGGEQDIMTTILADVGEAVPEAFLTLNCHDGHVWALPDSLGPPQALYTRLRPLVERTWTIQGEGVPIPAEWEVIDSSGEVVRLGNG